VLNPPSVSVHAASASATATNAVRDKILVNVDRPVMRRQHPRQDRRPAQNLRLYR
jgi:hypothetical protein